MARGGSAGAGAGGGGGIQAARRLGPGVATAVAALGAAAAVGAYAPIVAGRFERALAAPGALAILLLAVALLSGWAALVPPALAVLGADYAGALVLRGHAFDGRVPLVAAALVSAAELAYWSLELRGATADEGRVLLRRLLVVLTTIAATLLATTFLAAAATLDLGAAAAWEALAVVGAVGALVLIVVLTREAG